MIVVVAPENGREESRISQSTGFVPSAFGGEDVGGMIDSVFSCCPLSQENRISYCTGSYCTIR